jgi:hypothetical protein
MHSKVQAAIGCVLILTSLFVLASDSTQTTLIGLGIEGVGFLLLLGPMRHYLRNL